MPKRTMLPRRKKLAAEIFGYSYEHYEGHRGNIRFDRLMPDDIYKLERAEREGWEPARLAEALEIPVEQVDDALQSYREAKDIVDAPTAAESFRRGVRISIQHALKKGLSDVGSLERLVTQICYRAADLGFLLDEEGKQLSEYSQALREESEYDRQFNSERIRRMLEEDNSQ